MNIIKLTNVESKTIFVNLDFVESMIPISIPVTNPTLFTEIQMHNGGYYYVNETLSEIEQIAALLPKH